MRPPTALQRASWEATVRLGSQTAAARELGVSQATVRNGLVKVARWDGHTGPLPGKGTTSTAQSAWALRVAANAASGRSRRERERLEREEARIAELSATYGRGVEDGRREMADDRDAVLLRIEEKLDRLLARPLVAPPISHRRIRDGGVPVREQLRRRS